MLGPTENSIRVRPISSELSILGNCDGSARVKQGNSSIIVGIWGPVEVRQSKEDPEQCVIETTVRSASGQGSPTDKAYEEALSQTCRQMIIMSAHPRTSIQVIAQIESDDGSILAVMHTALCLALMDAGLPLRGMFAGVACAQLEDGELCWDPTADDEVEEATARFTFVYENSPDKKAVYTQCIGVCKVEQYVLVLQKGRQVAEEVFKFYRDSFEKLMRNDVKYQMLLPPIIKNEIVEESTE